MELIKQAQLIEVSYDNNGSSAIMTFLSEDTGKVYEVRFHKQSYDRDKNVWVNNDVQAQKAEEWSQKYFGTDFDHISDSIDKKFDVYSYERFASLWESDVIDKFTLDDVDDFFDSTIKEIKDDGTAIRIRFEHDKKTYESKMTYGKYVESLRKWFPNPQKQTQVYQKFEEKFGVPIKDSDTLVGHPIRVEVKKAFNKFAYADIKKLK